MSLSRKDLPKGSVMVEATQDGHYGGRYRNKGDVFQLANAQDDFHASWMRLLTGKEESRAVQQEEDSEKAIRDRAKGGESVL